MKSKMKTYNLPKKLAEQAMRELEAVETAQRELHNAAWNEKQAERRRLRLEEAEVMRAKAKAMRSRAQTRRGQPGLALTAALALAGSMITLPSK